MIGFFLYGYLINIFNLITVGEHQSDPPEINIFANQNKKIKAL